MYLLAALPPLLPFSLASPLASPAAAPCAAPSVDWQVDNLIGFTAAPGPNGVSQVSFSINDPVSGGLTAACSRKLPRGSGKSPVDPDHFYFCQDSTIQFKYTTNVLYLKQVFTCNGKQVTASGNGTFTNSCVTGPGTAFGNGTICTASPDPLDIFPIVS